MLGRSAGLLIVVGLLSVVLIVGAAAHWGDPLHTPRTELSAPIGRLAFDDHLGPPVVEAWINGRGPFKLILDTGAGGGLILEQAIADSLGLKRMGSADMGDPGHPQSLKASVSRVDSLRLGDVMLRDVLTIYRAGFMPIPGPDRPQGVISYALLGELLLTIDYGTHTVEMVRGSLPIASGDSIVNYETRHGVPAIPVALGDLRLTADLDCGSSHGLTLPERYLDSLRFTSSPTVIEHGRTVNGESVIRGAPLAGELRLGGKTYVKPIIGFWSMPVANLGHQFLRDFAVTIDQRNKRIRFRPVTTMSAASQAGAR